MSSAPLKEAIKNLTGTAKYTPPLKRPRFPKLSQRDPRPLGFSAVREALFPRDTDPGV